VVDWKIGVRMAPVVGSGVTPPWTCLVRKPMGRLCHGVVNTREPTRGSWHADMVGRYPCSAGTLAQQMRGPRLLCSHAW